MQLEPNQAAHEQTGRGRRVLVPKRATAGETAARASSRRNHARKPEPPTRVLCYSPYTMWELHGLWETTILHSLRLRGADVRYVLCDGLYSECDVFRTATYQRSERSCIECQARVSALMQKMAMPYEWLGRYTLPSELDEARRWADSLPLDRLEQAIYNAWPIADWVRSSVHTHLRRSRLDFSDEQVARVFRGYLSSGLTAALGLTRLLDEFQPDVLLQFNGRQSSTRVALELARAREIRVVCHERGARRGALGIVENVHCVGLAPIRQTWQEWHDIPLSEEELERAHGFLIEREHGVNRNWKVFSPAPQSPARIRGELGLEPGRPLWVIFTSSDDEVVAEDDWHGPIEHQLEWIDRTVAFATAHSELDLVIRVHPNTGGSRSTGRNEGLLQAFEELAGRLPANARLVRPDDQISSYTLMDLCDLGLVWHSGVAFELAMKGKRALIGAGSIVRGYEFVHDVVDAEGYETQLESMLEAGPLPPELQRLAYRWAYATYFRRDLPFPLIEMPDPHTGRPTYTSLDELRPGRDATLDRLARILLDGEPACLPPGPKELERTSEAEDRFFGITPDDAEPRVSIVIPCHNYGDYVGEAVSSSLAQTLRRLEVIVVDDGSTDNSLEVVEEIVARNPERVRLIRREASGQPAYPRNDGIAVARGEYIVCLDADDALPPNYVAECVRVLDANPGVSIAYGDQQNIGALDTFEPHPDYDFARLRLFNFIPTSAMFRRAAWEETGGYMTNVPSKEDWNFWLSCGAKGYYGKHVPGTFWFYRHHSDRESLFVANRKNEAGLKAQVVLNHPQLYGPLQRRWAESILAGEAEALALFARIGVVPKFVEDEPAEIDADKLSIVFFMYGWADEGGGTMRPREVARELARRGHRVSVISTPPAQRPDKPAYWVDEQSDDGVRVFSIYNRPAIFFDLEHPEREESDPQMRAVVGALLDELRPDIVHYHSLLNFSLGVPEDVAALGLPSVYSSRNYWPLCPRMYLYHADLEPCTGPEDSGEACAACIGGRARPEAYASRIRAARHAIDRAVTCHLALSKRALEVFAASGHDTGNGRVIRQQPQTVEALWREVGAGRKLEGKLDRRLRLGFIGNLLPHKGVHVLATALRDLPVGAVEATFYGSGPEAYIDVVRKLAPEDVSFRGGYDGHDLPRILAEIDVAVIPSVCEEIGPITAAEALAARVPVIGSRIGGLPELIADGETGLLVEPRNIEELTAAIRRFLDEPELLGRMQRAIAEPRSFAAYIDELVERYRDVIVEHDARKHRLEGTRRFAALAFADELLADPTLLAEYGRVFSGADDATLVIYGETPAEALVEAVARAGLDAEDAADLLALAGAVDSAAEKRLARGVDALLSRRPRNGSFAGLPLCDKAEALRELAEESWAN